MLIASDVLQERYRVVRPLGRGGMGAVYEAVDERLGRAVALKETLAETEQLRRAFEREARLLANLRHPALPKVLDHFVEGEGMFLVMEYIPGEDLGRMLEQGREFTAAEVLRWADQLLDAFEYLHALDPPVLHRDVKPSNLKLGSREQIILLDFGLAKGSAGHMTRAGTESVLGYSPSYSPLEQIQSAGTDQRSDLYSLGATLYHLATGVMPPDALSRATAVVNGQPDLLRPAREVNSQVPANVSAALMRAMALNVERRPSAASEMRRDLHDAAPTSPVTVAMGDADETTRISLPEQRAGAPTPDALRRRERGQPLVIPVPEDTRVAPQRRASRAWVGVASVLLLGALATTLYLRNARNDGPPPAPPGRPGVRQSPTPSVSPTPEANINQQDSNTQPTPGPEELAARARLAQKNLPFSEEAFVTAVERGDSGAVELFLAAGINPDAKDGGGRTALIAAAARGRDDISRKLLGGNADANAADDTGATALIAASAHGHKDTVKVLMENGSRMDLQDRNGQTALSRAAAQGHNEVVRLLLAGGANAGLKDKDGRDALAWAERGNHQGAAELLRRARATKP